MKTDPALDNLLRSFNDMVVERSEWKGEPSYGYQAGFYTGFLHNLLHCPEVEAAMEKELQRWEREKEYKKV